MCFRTIFRIQSSLRKVRFLSLRLCLRSKTYEITMNMHDRQCQFWPPKTRRNFFFYGTCREENYIQNAECTYVQISSSCERSTVVLESFSLIRPRTDPSKSLRQLCERSAEAFRAATCESSLRRKKTFPSRFRRDLSDRKLQILKFVQNISESVFVTKEPRSQDSR